LNNRKASIRFESLSHWEYFLQRFYNKTFEKNKKNRDTNKNVKTFYIYVLCVSKAVDEE